MNKTIKYTFLALHFLLTPCLTQGNVRSQMLEKVDKLINKTVAETVICVNPEILIPISKEAISIDNYFKEYGTLPYSFEKVKLGNNIFGYRSDLIPSGSGASGFRHSRLFELKGNKLELILDLEGYYLFIADSESINGRYVLWHWIGHPNDRKSKSFKYENGKYIEYKK